MEGKEGGIERKWNLGEIERERQQEREREMKKNNERGNGDSKR